MAAAMTDLFALLDTTIFELAGAPVTWTELLGFATGIASVWLAAAGRVATFPVGIANAVFFGLLFLDARLYADAALQIVYVGMMGFGWWAWLRLGPGGGELRISDASRRLLAGTALAVVALTLVLVPILREAHGSAPFLDALTTSMSLGAQALLCLKKLQSWYVWIAVDLIYIPLYMHRGLVLTAIVYVVFTVICLRAVVDWRRVRRTVPAGSKLLTARATA